MRECLSKKIAPPSSTGPAGADFEARVGAVQMLAMLKGAPARGLPEANIERVELQRAADGFPLDDVIIHGRDASGSPATLQIQVKRQISFSPKDEVFKDVVGQIAEAINDPAFFAGRNAIAIATAKATGHITGTYQELLGRARSHTSATTFMRHIDTRKLYSEDMRVFVATLRGHLKTHGAKNDDETIWQVLRRLQIHFYDFLAKDGSGDEANSRSRAADILHVDARTEVSNLWEALIVRTMELAADGGEATTQSLTEHFRSRFQFEGDTRYHAVRARVADAATLAFADVSTTVHGVSLPRTKQIDAVRAAITSGMRFIEIRGEAGLGKSGLLKKFAEEIAAESRSLVLAPGRVVARGWDAMRTQLGFSGDINSFLRDLAADGGGWLFIDNLDFYTADEQATVNDLLRAAAKVPSFTIVATVRTRFGMDTGSWLAPEAVKALGRAHPVIVQPIDDDELELLRETEPRLHALLAPDHPASAVTRNLYLLSRLLKLPEGASLPRTEIDMAAAWWASAAGGASDESSRERGRVLRELGTRAIHGEITFDVSTLDAMAIDALVKSEALSDFGNDRVAFRHDVLRDWAVVGLLTAAPEKLVELPLASMGSPTQLRGLELAARTPIETDADPAAWRKMLDLVSVNDSHPIWRRAILLAIIHSEVTKQSIETMGNTLLADDAALLRELIPIMLAVDVRPARDLLQSGADSSLIPSSLNIPIGPAWPHLVTWLLIRGAGLPPKAIPEVVELYVGWCTLAMFIPNDPIVPLIVMQFRLWLTEIELAQDWTDWRERNKLPKLFAGALSEEQLKRVEEDARLYLALFAIRAPDAAKAYLLHVQTLNRKEGIHSALMKTRGTLAQAAPDELAAITLDYLRKPKDEDKDDDDDDGLPDRRRSLFSDSALAHADKDFMPEAPSQGPFYDLLTHAPEVGLKLIRDLIDGVVAYHTDGKDVSGDALVIEMPAGSRRFPVVRTYAWSEHSHYYSVTSALMALETWGHERIERGDDVTKVLNDILSDGEPPAAYVSIAVHLILSHWPKSAAGGVPFLGCPELLSLDISRPIQTAFNGIDVFGFGQLSKEPANGPRLSALEKRVSRQHSLDSLLSHYVLSEPLKVERDRLVTLLRAASARLGKHEAADNRGDPRLMAYLALNLLEPDNWTEETHLEGGKPVQGFRYNPPSDELAHFEPMQASVASNNTELAYITKISSLIDHTENSSVELATALQKWAEEKSSAHEIPEQLDQALVGAAMIAMRDGDPQMRANKRDWAERQFNRATCGKPDVGGRMRAGMLYNPAAMAFAGHAFALRATEPTRDNFKRLLDIAVLDPAAARGASAAAIVLDEIDPRLRRSILRVAFASAVYFWHPWDVSEAVKRQSDDDLKAAIANTIDVELKWLMGAGLEPSWPRFVEEEIKQRVRRRRIRIGVEPHVEPPRSKRETSRRFIDHQAAALWLSALLSKAEADADWMEALEESYRSWTFAANGGNLNEDEEISEAPSEWNAAFFSVMTSNFRKRSLGEINAGLAPLFALPDEPFFDLMEDVLFKIDALFFNAGAIAIEAAIAIRSAFADRLAKSYGWQHLRHSTSTGIEIHLGPAVATLFFNAYKFRQAPSCYLPDGFIVRSIQFTPLLQRQAVAAPCLFVALCVMSLVEAAPTNEHLPLVVEFAAAAVAARPNDKSFWADHGMGGRICNWLADRFDADSTAFAPHRAVIDHTVAHLVAAGIAEARRLEIKLNSGK